MVPLGRNLDITRAHKNDHRLAWDILKIPHHCSYLSMAEERATTRPNRPRSSNGCSSRVPSVRYGVEQLAVPSTTEDQPPHVEGYSRYKDTARQLDASLVVTMENPSKDSPKRTVITIDGNGPTLKRDFIPAAIAITSTRSPRVG